jgi:hypothetical protein
MKIAEYTSIYPVKNLQIPDTRLMNRPTPVALTSQFNVNFFTCVTKDWDTKVPRFQSWSTKFARITYINRFPENVNLFNFKENNTGGVG